MENVAREPNGRVSRSGIDHGPADVVAIEARMRHTGLSREKAKDQKAETFIGYLNLIGPRDGLSDDQYGAITSYTDLRSAYLRAIKAPNAVLSNGEIGMPSPEVSDGYVEWCRAAREHYRDCEKAIMAAQMENRSENLLAALDLIIIRGERHNHLIGATRILANHLARFFHK